MGPPPVGGWLTGGVQGARYMVQTGSPTHSSLAGLLVALNPGECSLTWELLGGGLGGGGRLARECAGAG